MNRTQPNIIYRTLARTRREWGGVGAKIEVTPELALLEVRPPPQPSPASTQEREQSRFLKTKSYTLSKSKCQILDLRFQI